MKNLNFIIRAMAFLLITSVVTVTHAEPPKGGLFVNLTTDNTRAATKAIMFAHKKVLKRGYKPVAIWLNVRGIYLADKDRTPRAQDLKRRKGKSIQGLLKAFIKDGGIVIACRACSKAAGFEQADFIDGVKMGNAKLISELLFNPMVKTLSW
ncbi:MAG: DsrE family protein [Gammaproteobacteria bacterium]|nr:DsrE family protein [Gammaproteobacteria bacterium]